MIDGITIDLGDVVFLDDRLQDGAIDGVKAAALYVKGEAGSGPPVQRKRVAQDWTIRQRKFFFAALRSGRIEVPYRRGMSPGSQRAMQRWGVTYADGGLTATVGNNAAYSPYLYDPARQALYHKGNWKTTAEIARNTGPRAREIVATVIRGKLKGM